MTESTRKETSQIDLKCAPLTTNDPQRKSSRDASKPSAQSSQLASPMNGLSSFEDATTAFSAFVALSRGETCLQPSAVAFTAGIAFDYVNFPRIVSVSWSQSDNQSDTSVVVRDKPRMVTSETASKNIEIVSGASVFNWCLPHNEHVDPLISTCERKGPMGLIKQNFCEFLKETSTRFDKQTAVTQETKTLTQPLEKCQAQKQLKCCKPTYQATPTQGEASVERNPKKTSFDHIQLNKTNRRRKSGQASNCELLGQKRATLNPLHVTFSVPDDNNQGILKALNSLSCVTHHKDTSARSCFSVETGEQLSANDNKSKIFEASGASASSTESKQAAKVETDNRSITGSQQSTDLEKVERSCLQTGEAQENVRDLITRIRYIKSRLHRAESDFRKKRMLRAIVALRKRVKALTEGTKKKKTDPCKTHHETGASYFFYEGANGQESTEKNRNMKSGSNVRDMADGVLETNDLIMDKGDVSLKSNSPELTSASSEEVKEQRFHDQQNGEEQAYPHVLIAKYDNDVESGDAQMVDVVKHTTSFNSKCENISMKNNKSRQDCGSLTLITSNGGDVPPLSLPFGIGLDCSLTCGKRTTASSDDKNNLQNFDNTDISTKKLKGSSLSEEDLKGTSENKAKHVRRHVQSLTQDGALTVLVLNESDANKKNGTTDEGNVARNDNPELLLTTKEFILGSSKDFMRHSNRDSAQDFVIGTLSGTQEPSSAPLDSKVQTKERKLKENSQHDKGDDSLPPDVCQVSSAATVDRKIFDNHQGGEKATNLPAVVADHNNNTESSESKINTDKLRLITSCNGQCNNINTKNSSCRKERGSLSLIQSNGGNVPFLNLSFAVGSEVLFPCRKRAASSFNFDGKYVKKYENDKSKKMQSSPLPDEELKPKITETEDVSHQVRNVRHDRANKNNPKRDKNNVTATDDCDLLTRREFILCYPAFTQYNNCDDNGTVSNVKELINSPLYNKVQLQENEVKEERQADKGTCKDCSATMDDIKKIDGSNNSANEYDEMDEKKPECSQMSEHKVCSEGIHGLRYNPRLVEDNTNEEEHQSPLLERILLDEETQGFTSPTIHNPSGRQEDVDLMQSLQIREARIRNLARKRERLLNLAGLISK